MPDVGEETILGVMRYVVVLARRYKGRGVDLDELIAAGNLGVVEAAVRFDPERRVKFISYADWWIRKAILEELEQRAGPVRLPKYQLNKLRRIRNAREEWITIRQEEPDLEQLSMASKLSVSDVARLCQQQHGRLPLDLAESEARLGAPGETLTARGEGPLRSVIRRQLADQLRSRFLHLAAQERAVLDKRFGLDGNDPRALRQTARELGISRERVRRIEIRALLKLRELF